MVEFDVAAIVPSTRDLLQVLARRRQSLAIVALMPNDGASDEAARLDDQGVAAFACLESGPLSVAIASSTKTVPLLVLAEVGDRDGALRARFSGANGVCLPPGLEVEAWDSLAKAVRTTRMLALATASNAAELDLAVKAGARVILIYVGTAGQTIELAALASKQLVLVSRVESASLDELARLVGVVDAVIVSPAAHRDPGFAAFMARVDP